MSNPAIPLCKRCGREQYVAGKLCDLCMAEDIERDMQDDSVALDEGDWT
jgi:predicted amidophosphoribosyltransferase